jgi:hypothetical protein
MATAYLICNVIKQKFDERHFRNIPCLLIDKDYGNQDADNEDNDGHKEITTAHVVNRASGA